MIKQEANTNIFNVLLTDSVAFAFILTQSEWVPSFIHLDFQWLNSGYFNSCSLVRDDWILLPDKLILKLLAQMDKLTFWENINI